MAGPACSASTAPIAASIVSYGRIEDGGLRCLYHGWLYDVTGAVWSSRPSRPESQVQGRDSSTGLRGDRARRPYVRLYGKRRTAAVARLRIPRATPEHLTCRRRSWSAIICRRSKTISIPSHLPYPAPSFRADRQARPCRAATSPLQYYTRRRPAQARDRAHRFRRTKLRHSQRRREEQRSLRITNFIMPNKVGDHRQ